MPVFGQVWQLTFEQERAQNVQLHSIYANNNHSRLLRGIVMGLSEQRQSQQARHEDE